MELHVNEILPFLYLGDYYDSVNFSKLQAIGVNFILNVKESVKYPPPPFQLLHVPLSDYGTDHLEDKLEICFDFIGTFVIDSLLIFQKKPKMRAKRFLFIVVVESIEAQRL